MQGSEVASNAGSTNPVGTTHPPPPSPTKGAKPVQLAPSNPYFRLAIVAGILLPIATVPYLLFRRRISGLQYRCEELEWKLNVLERRLNFNVSESSSIRAEQDKMRATLHDTMQQTAEMRQEGIHRAADQSQMVQLVRSDLQKLVEETKQIRSQFATLRAVGVSLADVAAFMHEMELQMGLQSDFNKDTRGIHRLRSIALQIQSLTQQKEKEKEHSKNP